MSAIQRALSKSLRLQKPYARQATRSLSLLSASGASSRASGLNARNLPRTTTTTTAAAAAATSAPFHTMASLQSASATTPKPSQGVGYDPEIKDIANYIHNYKIDSDLAVSPPPPSSHHLPTRG